MCCLSNLQLPHISNSKVQTQHRGHREKQRSERAVVVLMGDYYRCNHYCDRFLREHHAAFLFLFWFPLCSLCLRVGCNRYALIHVSLKARNAVVLLRPIQSRGTDLPATALPLMVIVASDDSRNSENISCAPVADCSFINSSMKGAESLSQVRLTWPIALRNHSVCDVRPSPEDMKSQPGFICRFDSPFAPLNAPK